MFTSVNFDPRSKSESAVESLHSTDATSGIRSATIGLAVPMGMPKYVKGMMPMVHPKMCARSVVEAESRMIGIKVEQEDEGEGVQSHAAGKKSIQEEDDRCWCPFEYEFLPEFCYVCGMLGHEDKMCKVKLKHGEKAQFGPWMRSYMPWRSV